MTEEMRKRLEEVAREYAYENYKVDYSVGTTPYSVGLDEGARVGAEDGFLAGAEWGYKEAIAMAKEWLKNNVSDYAASYIVGCSKGEFISDFEADMNKLLEEKK